LALYFSKIGIAATQPFQWQSSNVKQSLPRFGAELAADDRKATIQARQKNVIFFILNLSERIRRRLKTAQDINSFKLYHFTPPPSNVKPD
jgi:hypothetical protein